MKELTIEEKAKAYDEALKKARQLCCYPTTKPFISDLQDLFPELQESEDELTWLTKYIEEEAYSLSIDIRDNEDRIKLKNLQRSLAWLEKQGEQINLPKFTFDDVLALQCVMETVKKVQEDKDLYKQLQSLHNRVYDIYHFETQDEQEPIIEMKSAEESLGISSEEYNNIVNECLYGESNSSDNIEPKFKVGDWVVDNCDYVWKIEGILNQFYLLEGVEGGESRPTIEWVNKTFHLWSIQDAKDGDVLVCPIPKTYDSAGQIFMFKGINSRTYVDNCIEFYCRVHEGVFYGNENAYGYMGTTSSPIYPATKEQRETLIKAMTDAGYTFDFENKELKKIAPSNKELEGKV